MQTEETLPAKVGLDQLEPLRAGYQRHLASILACGHSLIRCDAWYYDPERFDAILEISRHIQSAVTGMKAAHDAIMAIEHQLGMESVAS